VGTTPVDWVMEWGSKFYVRRYLLWKKYMVYESTVNGVRRKSQVWRDYGSDEFVESGLALVYR
jgi:hypothetical protein